MEIVGGVSLVNVHIPVKTGKRPFFDALIRMAKESSNRPLLAIGDFNTGSHAHDREGGYRFACEDDFRALSSHAGLIDLWRRQHHDRRDWSWHSGKNGFRIDHAFANAALLERYPLTVTKYDHSTRYDRLTDHSAMIVELSGEIASMR